MKFRDLKPCYLGHKRLYEIWQQMKRRCYNSNSKDYAYYGNKGITVCDEWLYDYNAFCEWSLSNGYTDSLTIDRIENNKKYCPDNCRWVDYKTQENNRTYNKLITYNGKTQNIKQWAEETGINYKTLWNRLCNYNWEIGKALTKGKKEV